MPYEISIDTGGTFTDGVLLDDQGTVSMAKSNTIFRSMGRDYELFENISSRET